LSALVLMTRLANQLGGLVSALDIDLIGKETQKALNAIKHLAAEARLDVRDYEMSDSRADMEKNARIAVKRLEELRGQILLASEHGIFSAVDVVVLSAQLDEIVSKLG